MTPYWVDRYSITYAKAGLSTCVQINIALSSPPTSVKLVYYPPPPPLYHERVATSYTLSTRWEDTGTSSIGARFRSTFPSLLWENRPRGFICEPCRETGTSASHLSCSTCSTGEVTRRLRERSELDSVGFIALSSRLCPIDAMVALPHARCCGDY